MVAFCAGMVLCVTPAALSPCHIGKPLDEHGSIDNALYPHRGSEEKLTKHGAPQKSAERHPAVQRSLPAQSEIL